MTLKDCLSIVSNYMSLTFSLEPADVLSHRMAWVGRDLRDHPAPPTMGRDTFHYTRLLKAPSSLALNTSRDGASTASLDSLTTLRVKYFFLIPYLDLPSFTLITSCPITTLPDKESLSCFLVGTLQVL